MMNDDIHALSMSSCIDFCGITIPQETTVKTADTTTRVLAPSPFNITIPFIIYPFKNLHTPPSI